MIRLLLALGVCALLAAPAEAGIMPDKKPHAWCGWWMRHHVGRDPGVLFNLARAWAHWGHATVASVGAIVVWPHHVGVITGRDRRGWIVKSGNDGHRVRERPRSLAGAIAFRKG